ncbi:MAG TPA: efflux RND transporter periplasmic adaptor subunit [Gemmatimonadales bacterium]|nr:efflux RND transporter periplasmic adaptor subunit [Gemmatimonadales bacterium]
MDNKSADLSALRINRDASPPTPGGNGGSRRWLVIGIPVVLLLTLTGFLVARSLAGGVEVHLTPAVRVSPSQANVLASASGYVVAQRKAAVASKATGRLVYLGVVEGDRVKEGQVIARIEDGDVRAQLAQARANLDLGTADLHNAQVSLDRQAQLLKNNLASQADFDAAQASLARVKATMALDSAQVDAARVAVENTIVRAPFDGTVLTKSADVGEVVSPLTGGALSKASVVTVADLGSLQVEVDVSESNLAQVTIGEPCEIILDAYPDVRYAGSVAKVVPTADRAKATVQVKVAFKHYDAKVLPEMSAKVHFLPRSNVAQTPQDTQSVIAVPEKALAMRNGQAVVYVVSDGRAVEVAVTAGRHFGSSVAILQGIAVGTAVVDSVDDRLHRGVKVNVKSGTSQ